MQRRIIVGAIACTVCSAALAEITFDAASVKPATAPAGVTVSGDKTMVRKGAGIQIPRNTGGPGTEDPGRIHYPLISLKALLNRAWDSYFEIRGPGWLDDDLVWVDATMPPETTKEQFQEMLRNLIIERFALKYHTDSKEITGYALVAAKNGLNSGNRQIRPQRPRGRPCSVPPPEMRMAFRFCLRAQGRGAHRWRQVREPV